MLDSPPVSVAGTLKGCYGGIPSCFQISVFKINNESYLGNIPRSIQRSLVECDRCYEAGQ